uniref:PiggyBac transposable element-derived protein domain-containing protein n=1 Tax=Anopheles stephensi TaxID=30069 RepID=A0A182YRW5_ANOST
MNSIQSTEVEQIQWHEFSGRQTSFTFELTNLLNVQLACDVNQCSVFSLFVDDSIINVLVQETNRYAQQKLNRLKLSPSARMHQWKPTNPPEIKQFIGLLLWMGLVNVSPIANYWSKKNVLVGKIFQFCNQLQDNFQKDYTPGEDIVIDESLIPWRGRLIFRQYITNKAHKYGIKLLKLCANDGYTWAMKIYSGKSADGIREIGLAQNKNCSTKGEHYI